MAELLLGTFVEKSDHHGSKNQSKSVPKSLQIGSQNRSKSSSEATSARRVENLKFLMRFWCLLGSTWGSKTEQNGTFSVIFRVQVALVSRRWFRIASDVDFEAVEFMKTVFPSRRESNFQVFDDVDFGVDFEWFWPPKTLPKRAPGRPRGQLFATSMLIAFSSSTHARSYH